MTNTKNKIKNYWNHIKKKDINTKQKNGYNTYMDKNIHLSLSITSSDTITDTYK